MKIKKITYVGLLALSLSFGATAYATPTADSLQEAQDEVAQLNDSVSNLVLKQDELKGKIDSKQKDLDKLNEDISSTQKTLDKRVEQVKKLAQDAQVNGSTETTSYFDVLFNSKSISDFVTNAMATKTLVEAKTSRIKETTELKEELANKKEKVEKETAELKELKAEADENVKEANAKKAEAEASVKELETKYANELAEAEEASKRAQQAIQQQQATTASTTTNTTSESSAKTTEASSTTAEATPAQSTVSSGGYIGLAQSFLGTPYVWGGTSPSGFDCSGLVQYVLGQSGISIGRTSQEQSTVGSYVDVASLQPGDLVFWGGVGSAHHVGIYIGGGNYIHAPKPGDVVKVQSMQWYCPDFGRRL